MTPKEEDRATEAGDTESGMVTPGEGLITPSGISSGVPTGVETPDSIELRKKKLQEEGVDTPASLYTVLPEKRLDRVGGQMMASTHVYDLSAAKKDKSGGQPTAEGGIEVSLNPEELDLQDPTGLQKESFKL